MALKSKEWFLGRCLDEERKASALGPLSRRALDLGLKRSAKTAGHILQACGATQLFLEAHPKVKREIVESSPRNRIRYIASSTCFCSSGACSGPNEITTL